LPRPAPAAGRPPVDAAGTLALASAVVGLALLGGAPGWGSDLPGWFVPTAAALLVLGAAGWAAASRIAADPVLPPRLFGDRAIAASAAIAFLIGFTLFGTVGFTPAFLQIALEMPAAAAGMLVTALMAGVLVTTVLSGRLITRTGRYRGYPVAGTAVATMGLLLLSRLDAGSSPLLAAALLALLGLGIGLVMQVTVLVAQNSAAHADLGSATAAVTFLRQVGASAGVAVFGALLNLRFAALLPGPVAERAGGAAGLSPESLAALAPGDPARRRRRPRGPRGVPMIRPSSRRIPRDGGAGPVPRGGARDAPARPRPGAFTARARPHREPSVRSPRSGPVTAGARRTSLP